MGQGKVLSTVNPGKSGTNDYAKFEMRGGGGGLTRCKNYGYVKIVLCF